MALDLAVGPRQRVAALTAALEAGQPVDVRVGGVAADSLRVGRIGTLAFDTARRFVDRVVLVEDGDILGAHRLLWDSLRLVVEPGGAAAFAALLSGAYRPEPGERVGVALCGANADPSSLLP